MSLNEIRAQRDVDANCWSVDVPCLKPIMTSNEQRRAQWHQVRSAKSRTATDVAWCAKAAKLPKLPGLVRVTVTWWAPS